MSKQHELKKAVRVTERTHIAEDLKYEVVSDVKEPLTLDRCFEILELATFKGERDVSQPHVQFLYDAYSTGRFMWEQVTIGLCQCNGKLYRVNGQHTCWMRTNIKESIRPQVRVITYKVRDEESLRALYCTFDRNKSRSSGHSFKALAIGNAATDGLWTSVIPILGGGLKHWKFEGAKHLGITVEDIASAALKDYPDLFKSVGMLEQELYEYRPIRRVGVVAAMFATMQAAPEKTAEFWGPVATGLGFHASDKNDARYKLRQFLDTHGRMDKTTVRGAQASNSEETYRICINAWNKWRKSEPVMVLKAPDKRQKAI